MYDWGARRYPKRLKEYRPSNEDKPIHLAGHKIGYMISNIPYLNTNTWNNYGRPLYITEDPKMARDVN